MADLSKYGVRVPNILLPDAGCDYSKWAVIACDQFSSQPGYWDDVERKVADAPSTFRIIYPECYLGEDESRVASIQATMLDYRANVLTRAVEGFVLVERSTTSGNRLGLIVELDLDRYDYSAGSASLIRATEGTIEERLPPRAAIRRGAVLESPHIMVLVDDPGRTLIEPLYEARSEKETLYDFDLMSGGRIRGWAVSNDKRIEGIASALESLHQKADGLLFAVGDGNHSLATAKLCWEEKKASLSEAERESHPARFALVEIINLHDPANAFEPIHRAVFHADRAELTHDFTLWCLGRGMAVAPSTDQDAHMWLLGAPVRIENAFNPLPVAILQPFLDQWLSEHPEARIDYIHGKRALTELAGQGACCFELSAIDKFSLFESVRKGGALPRKTFSMGEATDKRYYLECRALDGSRGQG